MFHSVAVAANLTTDGNATDVQFLRIVNGLPSSIVPDIDAAV
jgi:hypothetical protein